MFCKRCGKQVKEGQKFCPSCGANLQKSPKVEPTLQPQPQPQVPPQPQMPLQPQPQVPPQPQPQVPPQPQPQPLVSPKKEKKSKKKVVFILIGLLVVIGVAVAAVFALQLKRNKENTPTEVEADSNSVSTAEEASEGEDTSGSSYADIKLGEDDTNLEATITLFNQRTDMAKADYTGPKNWASYITEFNKVYPNIKVKVNTSSNYMDDALEKLDENETDWGDIMMIPNGILRSQLEDYFLPLGDFETMKNQINGATQWMYDDQVYGVPSMLTPIGMVYNKKVFEKAGVTEKNLPKTTKEFLDTLSKIKKNNVIPLYTNYADSWAMGEWDAYITGSATGDPDYANQTLLHAKNPFQNYGDDTHAYAVYKTLYDVVQQGLTEQDYQTSSWEQSKTMLANGEIGCMALGVWAVSQIQAETANKDDIGYMPFPISVDGTQYVETGISYSYAVNKEASEENQKAALIFIKWMTEKSGYSCNEGGIPIKADETEYPDVYRGFTANKVVYIEDSPAKEGEEDLLDDLNSDSKLNIGNEGGSKIKAIVDHAVKGDQSFDDIMKEWNQAWSNAQKKNSVATE